MEYHKHLSEPWFSLIQLGLKSCEGRLKKGDFANMKKNDRIHFENHDFSFPRTFTVLITSIHEYSSFEEYLQHETLEKTLPGIDTLENGINVYRKYYTIEDENKYGIIAIRMRIIKNVTNSSNFSKNKKK